mmetsp:Transcript_43003/g.89821  ORF Transcript_43003/g.89821 Transcript_43003/m.89821 type:complete len:313 (-) Transcript_43003:129-1067(-)
MPHRCGVQSWLRRRPCPQADSCAGHRPDHVGGAQLPSHGQDAHGVRDGQADGAQAHTKGDRLGRRHGDRPRPISAAALLQAGQLGLHLGVRVAEHRAAHRQRRRFQLRRRRREDGAHGRRLGGHVRTRCSRQAMDLHRSEGATPLGHLVVGAAGDAQDVHQVRARALGYRRARHISHAQLHARVALVPLPLRTRRPARATPGTYPGAPAGFLRPRRTRDAHGVVERGRLGQNYRDAPRPVPHRLQLRPQAQGQRLRRVDGFHHGRVSISRGEETIRSPHLQLLAVCWSPEAATRFEFAVGCRRGALDRGDNG